MKLPVAEVAAETYHFLWRHRRMLVDRASLPMAIVLVVGIVEYLLGTPSGNGGLPAPMPTPEAGDLAEEPRGGIGVAQSVAYFLVTLPFLVGWYRLVVLGPTAIAGRSPLSCTRLEARFLLWMLLIGLVLAIPLLISGTIVTPFATGSISGDQVPLAPLLLSTLMFLALILASLRLSFIFPAIAAEEPASFARAWEMTKGNSLRILALALVAHIPALVLGAVVETFFIGLGLPYSLLLFVELTISFTIMALGATAFGVAYARLR
jgi:hypothetical protein